MAADVKLLLNIDSTSADFDRVAEISAANVAARD